MFSTLVISLPQDHDRYDDLLEHHRLHASYLNPVRVDAIHGSQLTARERREACSSLLYRPWLTASMLGCGLSHLKALRQFLDSSDHHEVALILEDDARIRPGIPMASWTLLVPQMIQQELDILHLGGHETEKGYQMLVRGNGPIITSNDVSIDAVFWWSTSAAYLVSRKGARQIVDRLRGNMIYHLDTVYQGLVKKKLIRGGCVSRPFFMTRRYPSHNADPDPMFSHVIPPDISHLVLCMSALYVPGAGTITLFMILGGMLLAILPWPLMIIMIAIARGRTLRWWGLEFLLIILTGRSGRIFWFTFWSMMLLVFILIFASASGFIFPSTP